MRLKQSLKEIWNGSDARNDIDRLMAFDLRHALLGDFIPKVDVSTMYHSLEARAPFLHHKLGDLAFSAPLDIKRMGGSQKGILKKILENISLIMTNLIMMMKSLYLWKF